MYYLGQEMPKELTKIRTNNTLKTEVAIILAQVVCGF